MMKNKKHPISSYLAVAISSSYATGNVMSQTITFFGANDTNLTPNGLISFTYTPQVNNFGLLYPSYNQIISDDNFLVASTDFQVDGMQQEVTFSCADFPVVEGIGYTQTYSPYTADGSFSNGATAGDNNFTYVTLNGDDGVYETIAQFSFDGEGGGFLVALYTNDDGSQASIVTAKGAIAAAVPEPSSIVLLSLGSLGLIARRNRKTSL